MGIHDGHREKLRKNFIEVGLDGKTDHQILEILLTYALPRIDVNPLAHELIDTFGSLSGVLDADITQLTKIKYVSENVAVLLKLIPAISTKYYQSKHGKRVHLNTVENIKDYMIPQLANEKAEVFYVLCLDTHLNLMRAIKHSEGSPAKTSIDIRSLANQVLNTGTDRIVLVHNHVSNSAKPSACDIEATNKIVTAFELLNVSVLDHIIIAGNKYFSFFANQKLRPDI
jgi:DNA repair protein RadC